MAVVIKRQGSVFVMRGSGSSWIAVSRSVRTIVLKEGCV